MICMGPMMVKMRQVGERVPRCLCGKQPSVLCSTVTPLTHLCNVPSFVRLPYENFWVSLPHCVFSCKRLLLSLWQARSRHAIDIYWIWEWVNAVVVALLPKFLPGYFSLARAGNKSVSDSNELSLQRLVGTQQRMVSVLTTSFAAILASSRSRNIYSMFPWSSQMRRQQRPKLPAVLTFDYSSPNNVISPAVKTHTIDSLFQLTTQKSVALTSLPVFYRYVCSTHFLFPSVVRACFCLGWQWRE